MADLGLLDVALGRAPADLVITGGRLVNVFTEEIYPADVAVSGSTIAVVGDVTAQTGPRTLVVDASGSFLVPGLIDGHLHVECSKLSLTMFAQAVVPLGTTSIVSGLDQIFVVAIQMATINCAQIYRIDHRVGSISPGRTADILLVDDLAEFRVRRVVAKGRLVAEDGRMTVATSPPARSRALLRTVSLAPVEPEDLQVRTDAQASRVRVMSMAMSQEVPFVRKRREVDLAVRDGVVLPDVDRDVLYVCVVERYGKSSHRPVAFVSGFELKAGAMASSASPDDNNILCVGTNPRDMAVAVNHLAAEGGGQVVVGDGEVRAFLALPIGGIVADLPPEDMARAEARLDDAARTLGCRLPSPFMYLIFLSITAIPDYAITDLGLIDCVSLEVMSPVLTGR
jgi:adenine deaminase